MLLSLAVSFGNGVLSFAAPCSVAALLIFAASVTSTDRVQHSRSGSLSPIFAAVAAFVLGICAVCTGIGITAGTAGRPPALMDMSPRRGGWIVVVCAALVVADLRLRWTHAWRLLFVGILCAATYVGCVRPLIRTASELAANTGDGASGGSVGLGYALGLCVPFLLAGLALAASPRLITAISRRRDGMVYAAAAVLASLGALLIGGRYDVVADWLDRIVLV